MKSTFTALFAVLGFFALVSCGSKPEKTSQEDYGSPEVVEATKPSTSDVIAQGESLVKANDCYTCHHATNKLIGPSHTDVAKKYEFTEENIKYLADKIIKGGTGVWGQVPMVAHPNLSQANAEKIARYVLSLDGEQEKK